MYIVPRCRGSTHVAHVQKLKLVGGAEEGQTCDEVHLKTSEAILDLQNKLRGI